MAATRSHSPAFATSPGPRRDPRVLSPTRQTTATTVRGVVLRPAGRFRPETLAHQNSHAGEERPRETGWIEKETLGSFFTSGQGGWSTSCKIKHACAHFSCSGG